MNDAETGLTYMQARYYDPEIGRFMGIDPVGFMEYKPVMFNRYAYVGNNPYKYVDPNGEYGVAGFLFGVGLEITRQYLTKEQPMGSDSIDL